MDSEQTFWLAIWRTVATAFACAVVAIAGCTSFTNHKIAEMTTRGIDPIAAGCAIRSNGNDPICVITAQKAKQ